MRVLFFLLCLCLSACSPSGKVAVIAPNGQLVMDGEFSSTISGGYFTVTNGRTTCTGAFNAEVQSEKLTAPVFCTDGRQGKAVITRQLNGYDGYGELQFSDGPVWRFVFGRLSQPFLPPPTTH